MKRSCTGFCTPLEISEMQLADCPMSDELAAALASLDVRSFGEARRLSLHDLRRAGDKSGALALELGCLIRRAARGEFGRKPALSWLRQPADFWWKGSLGQEEAAADSCTQAGGASDDAFFVPEKARRLRLGDIPLSSRVRNLLQSHGLEFVGGLHRVTAKQILLLEGAGPKTLQELREVIRLVLEGRLPPQPPPSPEEDRNALERFAIPQGLHPVSPYQFSLSRRLDGVLRRAGITCLGDLDGLEFRRLLVISNCGRKTFQELLDVLERAAGGAGCSGIHPAPE